MGSGQEIQHLRHGDLPSFFGALEEQLGLKLVSRTAPIPTLVIDHVERPSEN